MFLAAKNVDEAQTMLNEITTALLNANLQWKAKEAACMGVGDLADAEIFLDAYLENDYKHIPNVKALTILGSRIDQKACCTTSIMHRRAIAERCFWANHTQLMCKNASRLKKLHTWMSLCGKCALFDCGDWTPNVNQLKELRVWENSFL